MYDEVLNHRFNQRALQALQQPTFSTASQEALAIELERVLFHNWDRDDARMLSNYRDY